MDTEAYEEESDSGHGEYDNDDMSVTEDSDNTDDEDEEEEEEGEEEDSRRKNNSHNSGYQLEEEKVLAKLEVLDAEEEEKPTVQGKGDEKQSVITKSTQNAFVNYLKQVTKKAVSSQHSPTIDKDQMNAVVHTLIVARGFSVLQKPIPPRHSNLKSLISGKRAVHIGVKSDSDERLCVFFGNTGKLGVQTAREIVKCIAKHHIDQVVIITEEGVTPVAIKSMLSLPCTVHFFRAEELVKNYTLHTLLPQQKPLSQEQEQRFLTKKKLQKKDMLQMSRVDPIVKFYGWSTGTIIQCTRIRGETSEPHVTYRVVG